MSFDVIEKKINFPILSRHNKGVWLNKLSYQSIFVLIYAFPCVILLAEGKLLLVGTAAGIIREKYHTFK